MSITRYQPSSDLFRPLLDDFFAPLSRMGSTMRTPDTDVVESENEIKVVAELPGMSAEQIDVSLENNILTISGEKEETRERQGEKAQYHLSERRWGRFSRAFVLPREVESDRIEAVFKDGVLTLSIPKSERAKPRRIEVSSQDESRRVEPGS